MNGITCMMKNRWLEIKIDQKGIFQVLKSAYWY